MNVVHLGDCLPAMREMEDNAFDLAVVDPPYGIGNWIQVDGKTDGGSLRHGDVKWNEISDRPNSEYFAELTRVSVDQIVWGANYYNCFSDNGGAIVWNKHNNNPRFSNAEIASYSKHKRVALVDLQFCGFHKENDALFHPCAKPIALYKWIYQNYAKPGQTILDTHVGSGSSRIAAWDAGLDFVGYEIDADYWDAQEKRFQDHIKQTELFDKQEMFAGGQK